MIQPRPPQDIESEVRSCIPVTSGLNTQRLVQPKRLVSDPVASVLSYLGSSNPYPQPVTKDDEVWLLDNTAFPSARGAKHDDAARQTWEAEFVAAVFSQHPSCAVSDAVVKVADKIGLADDERAKKTIEERLRPFLMDIQPGKQVFARHGGDAPLRLSPGGRNGISSDLRRVGAAPAGSVVPTTAQVPGGTTGLLQGRTFFADAGGWAVISDIDDTIKVTLTGEAIGILRSTFVDEPRPVPGMPELYRHLRARAGPAAPFFYLSASPYNLYPFLRGFRDAHYPHGQLVLRDASWMSLPGLFSSLTLGTRAYKVDRMKKIHGWLPGKRVVCIGDSTQTDPEAYARMYRDCGPDWVRLILIRRVTGVAAVDIEDKNKPARFEEAFRGVPKGVWHVFEDPSECYQIIQDVVGS